jgi:SAM-dependent methyltransferase
LHVTAALSLRDQRVARAIDREVAPIWHDRFARLLWRSLPLHPPALALDVHSGPGRTTAELLERLPRSSRIVSLEPDEAMRSIAKVRIPATERDRVYLKAGDMTEIADMGDDVYDLVVANLVLGEAHDLEEALRGLVRITKPGGQILATFPMEGTWQEAEDVFREVLRDTQLMDATRRLKRLARLRPSGSEVVRVVEALRLGPDHFVIEQERFSLLFRSGREFLFSPLVEHGPLRLWKAILGGHDKPQEIFWRLKEYLDAYFSRHAFSVTVIAGLLRLRVPQPGAAAAHAAAETAGEYWRRFPELDAIWQAHERSEQPEVSVAEDIDIDIDDIDAEAELSSDAADAAPTREVASRSPAGQAEPSALNAALAEEDEAIFAALDPGTSPPDEELDALLDQVLEFAGAGREEIEELEADAVEEIDDEPRKPGDTLKRIRALIPPHPDQIPKPPPLPGQKRRGP